VSSVKKILELLESIGDEHYVVVYGDHGSFRDVYAQHAKRQIEKNEVVILLPYYETAEKVRTALGRAGIDVRAHEGTGSLIIMDSYATFLGFRQENELFFSRMVSHAIVSGKAGICIVADMGAFFLIDRTAEIAAGRIRVRGFCAYHRRDFDKLSEGQRKAIFGRGYKALFVQQAS
jgi:KaiC/GvpD/RAD55 family RecA-like ATPase